MKGKFHDYAKWGAKCCNIFYSFILFLIKNFVEAKYEESRSVDNRSGGDGGENFCCWHAKRAAAAAVASPSSALRCCRVVQSQLG